MRYPLTFFVFQFPPAKDEDPFSKWNLSCTSTNSALDNDFAISSSPVRQSGNNTEIGEQAPLQLPKSHFLCCCAQPCGLECLDNDRVDDGVVSFMSSASSQSQSTSTYECRKKIHRFDDGGGEAIECGTGTSITSKSRTVIGPENFPPNAFPPLTFTSLHTAFRCLQLSSFQYLNSLPSQSSSSHNMSGNTLNMMIVNFPSLIPQSISSCPISAKPVLPEVEYEATPTPREWPSCVFPPGDLPCSIPFPFLQSMKRMNDQAVVGDASDPREDNIHDRSPSSSPPHSGQCNTVTSGSYDEQLMTPASSESIADAKVSIHNPGRSGDLHSEQVETETGKGQGQTVSGEYTNPRIYNCSFGGAREQGQRSQVTSERKQRKVYGYNSPPMKAQTPNVRSTSDEIIFLKTSLGHVRSESKEAFPDLASAVDTPIKLTELKIPENVGFIAKGSIHIFYFIITVCGFS